MSALGDTFRTTRESQGLSLSDVAERTHIRVAYLVAIETEDWNAIGPPVYVRGFVRNYARSLGLDPEAAIAVFLARPPGIIPAPPSPSTAPSRVEYGRPEKAPRRGLSLGALAGVLVALALVVFVGYQYVEYSSDKKAPAAPVRAAPASAAPAVSEAPGKAAEIPVREKNPDSRTVAQNESRPTGFAVRLRDNSWLRVVVDGKVAMEGLYPKGTERTFAGRSATVRVGNAGGVDVWLDGKDLGPMGGLGDVAERSYQL